MLMLKLTEEVRTFFTVCGGFYHHSKLTFRCGANVKSTTETKKKVRK